MVFEHKKKVCPCSTLIFALYSAFYRNQALFESPNAEVFNSLKKRKFLTQQSGFNNSGF